MDRATAEHMLDTLAAREGVVAMVGAGGKKSTLYRLLEAHRAIGTKRICIAPTVQFAFAAKPLDAEMIIRPPADMLDDLRSTVTGDGVVFIAAPSSKPGRFAGLPVDLVARLHDEGGFDVTLVKADGARMRMIKAPKEDEPVLPTATTILPIVSAKAFGRPLSPTIAHRPELLADVIAAGQGDLLSPGHVASLLTSGRGSLSRVGDATVIPVINMVDTPERLAPARQAATKALSMTGRFDRVVLSAMTGAMPIVDVISS